MLQLPGPSGFLATTSGTPPFDGSVPVFLEPGGFGDEGFLLGIFLPASAIWVFLMIACVHQGATIL